MHRQNTAELKLSVLMSICSRDNAGYLDVAIESIVNQTKSADEIVITQDGHLTQELSRTVRQWQQKHPGLLKIVSLPENSGLGVALQQGLNACSYSIIARMDADDISCPERFEKQLQFLQDNPGIAVVSSWMACFEDDPDKIIFIRKMPQKHEHIKKIARSRNPVLHPPVMFRRFEVEAVGGYTDLRRNQDYHLWVRMLLKGSKITCIPEPLYKFRCDGNFLKRRTDLKHAISMITLQKEFVKIGFISYPRYPFNIGVRISVCILPVPVTRFIRKKLLKL